MNTYTLFWRDGKAELIEGYTFPQALNLAGYHRTTLAAVEFHAVGDKRDKYVYNKKTHEWVWKEGRK